MTKVELSDNLSSNVWPRIKDYVLGQNPNAGKDETLYMCIYCKSLIKKKISYRRGVSSMDLKLFQYHLSC